MMDILQSLKPVLRQSSHVSINKDKIKDFVQRFDRTKLDHWLSISPFNLDQLSETQKIGFLFTLNAMSFSYFGNPKWTVEYHQKEYDGAQAMMACLGRAIERGINFNPDYLAAFGRETLGEILCGNVEIPLFNERLRNLNEIGAIIKRDFRGDFRYVIDRSHEDALHLVDLLVDRFSSFQDSAWYRTEKVDFNKRAQLLASDINYLFGRLSNCDKLTACADYKLPQVLRRYGILHYSDELQKKILLREHILSGSEEEVEIRAHTIYAVELIKSEIDGLTSNQINDYLWLEGQIKVMNEEPYHLTRTTAY